MPARIVRILRRMSRAVELFRDEIIELLPRLRRFARTITRNPHDADDLVQLTVERALLKYAQWQDEARLESWMFGIMRNASIDEVRSRVRQRSRVRAGGGGRKHRRQLPAKPGDVDIALQAALASPSRRAAHGRSGSCWSKVFRTRKRRKWLGVPIGTLTSRLARGRDALAVDSFP